MVISLVSPGSDSHRGRKVGEMVPLVFVKVPPTGNWKPNEVLPGSHCLKSYAFDLGYASQNTDTENKSMQRNSILENVKAAGHRFQCFQFKLAIGNGP